MNVLKKVSLILIFLIYTSLSLASSVISYKIKSGDTLGKILYSVGISESHKLAGLIDEKSKKEVRRHLRIGKEVYITSRGPYLAHLSIPVNRIRSLEIKIKNGEKPESLSLSDVSFNEVSKKTVIKYVYRNLLITKKNNSFYRASKAIKDKAIGDDMIDQMAETLGWQIDFNQELRVGDEFSIIYEEIFTEDGQRAYSGKLIAAKYTPAKNNERIKKPIYAILYKDGEKLNYYNLDGKNIQKAFLRYPLRFSRISSRFGNRRHPISKKWKAHKGVDFAAPKGTPVFATGDGTIERASYHRAYGNLVTIRHKNNVKTRYAHLSGFAKKMKKGRSVTKGQTIGYVGSTGYATGPHLHYEWINGNRKVNPLAIRMPSAEAVKPDLKTKFNCVAVYWKEILTTTFYVDPMILTSEPKVCV